MNKQEIIDISMKEGYFETSKGKEMCDVLASGNPKTKSNLEKILEEEKKCGMNELVEKALEKIRIENTEKEIKLNNEIINLCK